MGVKNLRRMSGLARWTDAYAMKDKLAEYSEQPKTKGLFYHKGGAGIERNPASKRKPNDAFNMRKVKGKMEPRRNIIVREKSKWEKNHPFTGL